MRKLRGHHLLCIHGFRGMGYSDSFVENMQLIVNEIKDMNVDQEIQVLVELDDACRKCPHHGDTICVASEASNNHVTSMDKRVIQHLDLTANNKYKKSEIIKRTKERVHPDDLDHLCKGCSWLSYGVCKEGIDQLRNT